MTTDTQIAQSEALIIVDMSNDFVHDDGGLTAGKPAQEIVPFIVTQADEMLKNGGNVIIAMDAHLPDDSHFEEWPPHNVIGTWGQKLYGALGEWYEKHEHHERVIYVPKPQYDAFYNTNLEQILEELGVKRVKLTGVCTDICVYLTTAGAYYRGLKTQVLANGCATFTENHESALKQMELCFHTEIA
ncbi:MAG: cysteine hydrolase [Candidatus Marinimicrobia bacterium]|nr:cysteine hydrolase [Candidatus Neomarinimicrobiota bacterium]MCF7840949.1 cysteine hydrolase [Candidatus Neomarinimicrobiota bacterium]